LRVSSLPINDLPTITSNGGGNAVAVSVAENNAFVTMITASDVDATTISAYAIAGGADAARFAVNSSTGQLTFITGSDFVSPADSDFSNVYEAVVQVSDGLGGIDTQSISVTVRNITGVTINGSAQGQTHIGTGEASGTK
jgi:hypothetical protein